MRFEKNHLYHIFNQGNNRGKIFFNEDNYLYFLRKIKTHIAPFADIVAWCLMPNHFHLMVYVNEVEDTRLPTPSGLSSGKTLISSIGNMLSSYTRAINKQENRSGSLFRSKTKAICLTPSQGLAPSYFNTAFGTQMNVRIEEKEYPQVCFQYIHQNPVQAKLVDKPGAWQFSSCRDYLNLRKGKLINMERAKEFGLI